MKGVISCREAISSKRTPTEPSSTYEFGTGYCKYELGVDKFVDGRTVCLALGQARFESKALQERAATLGCAAAWLSAYREHGVFAPRGVRGRFAVIVFNGDDSSAWLAVDRFNTYPLCHAASESTLAVATRADEVSIEDRSIAPQAIFNYLYFHMIPAPQTVFSGISRLEAGHMLHWQQGKVRIERYWVPTFAPDKTLDLDVSKGRFLEIIENAVRTEADGTRPGAFLSGGTDSSTVSGMLCKVLGGPAPTYSIGFDAAGYDEMAYARIAAKH
ncbi:MAG: asparagine synthase, partial [Betaproteobacteria bacterium HGW-Betaproteobacteria-21]